MKCNNCGSELKPGSGFCENCGMIISVDGADEHPAGKTPGGSSDNSAEFDAFLVSEGFGEDLASLKSSAEDEPSPSEAEAGEELQPDGGEARPTASENGDDAFEDVSSTDESAPPVEFEEEAETAIPPEDTDAHEGEVDYDGDDEIPDDGEDSFLVPEKPKRKKGPLVAAIIVVFIVAVGAGALTLKDGGFSFITDSKLFSIFKAPTAPNSASNTTETESTTLESTTEEESTSKIKVSKKDKEEKEESETKKKKKKEKESETEKEKKQTARYSESYSSASNRSSTTSASNRSSNRSTTRQSTTASTTRRSTTQSTTRQSTTKASTTKASTTKASTTKASTTKASTTKASTTKASTTKASTTKQSEVEKTTAAEPAKPDLIRKLGLPAIPSDIKTPDKFLSSAYIAYVSGAKGLTFYSRPSLSSSKQGTSKKGREIQILAKSGDYFFAYSSYYETYGWVEAAKVSETKPTTDEDVKADGFVDPERKFDTAFSKTITAYEGYVIVRNGPSKDYKRVTSLSNGTEVMVLGRMKGNYEWFCVREPMSGTVGWVSSQNLK